MNLWARNVMLFAYSWGSFFQGFFTAKRNFVLNYLGSTFFIFIYYTLFCEKR